MPADAEPQPKAGAVSPDPQAPESPHLSESMAELQELSDAGEPENRGQPLKKAPVAKKPEVAQSSDGKTDPEPEAKPVEKPKEGAEDPAKPVKTAELRVAYEKTKESLKTREAEIAKLKADLKLAQESPRDDPEKSTLLGKVEEFEKRSKALEERLRLVDYQQSEEFVKDHVKPWHDAWKRAESEIQELTIELEDGTSRPATVQDLVALSNMKLGDARKYAKQMFGDGSDEVMAHLRKLRDLSDAQQTALAEAKTKSETHFKQRAEQTLQERQKVAKLWKDENKAWRSKFPKWFQPADGDQEANDLLAKGYEMADRAFSRNGQTSPEDQVKLHAEMRNKAAAFPRIALELKRARSRIKELEKSVAEFEDSEPPAGEGGKPRTDKTTDDIGGAFAEIDQMDKK